MIFESTVMKVLEAIPGFTVLEVALLSERR